ncbi:thermonuclease family protein [Candidatus Methylospira mobilis]|uniref:thermonuclease family protein n=1 Tax=Candidatus Methylospira mobilis TaxID=1808979 RepID=UPI0028E8E8C6|nr:thermonuclease family protein [Candidatus Methylospira mobilis]WNV05927.1 thermonuclease family protein [Candidatus Methylospira mobilis]
MKTVILCKLIVIVILVCFTPVSYAFETLTGRVVGVHDGDTITLLTAENQTIQIRLAQIDAPELSQAFGQRSKQSLSDLVFNKTIKVVKTTDEKTYGRTLGTLLVGGIDANKEQVRRGMAWAYRQYLHDRSLLLVEADARQNKTGLWSDPNLIAPWEYRHEAFRF